MSTLLSTAEEYLDPTKFKLIIKTPDESQTTYTFDSFDLSSPPFDLTSIDVNAGIGQTGNFSFTIDDTKDRIIGDTIECGSIAIIQAAKKQADYKNIMYGIVDDVTDDYPSGNRLIYKFSGLGIGVILNYTFLNFVKSANKEDIVLPETIINDPEFRIDNLALELFQSTSVLPIVNSPTLQQRGGYNLDSIANTIKVILPSINNPYSTASTILENFASSSGTVSHIDANKNVYLRPPYKVHSGITIRQWETDPITGLPTRLNDSAEFTSYYFGGWSSRKMMRADQGFFNRVYLTINTEQLLSTSTGQTTPNFTSLAVKDIGQQFLPGSVKLFNVSLLLSKSGTGRSTVDDSYNLTGVQGLICEDNGSDRPSSKVIATFNIPYDQINTSPTAVYKIDLQYNVSSIDQNKLHWIILFKRGESEDSTIQWYHDSDFTTESTDELPRYSGTKKPFTEQPLPQSEDFAAGWGTNSRGPVYRHSFFVTNKTTMEVSDPISIKKYTPNRPVEIRVNAPWITDVRTGFKYANTLLQYGAKLKRIYEKKQLSIPTKGFSPLELVNIVYPPAGIDKNSNLMAEINNVHWNANAYNQENPFGSYFVDLTAVGYMNHYQNKVRESLVCTQ
ncbi:hypothetical protein [Serratia sp. (in: enterobacteria)]|uniref:hypothetical protein n=1 Tax=Serratia sp. (in: enterobacteria) TaxID=616 RepID=UPI00398A2F46